MKRVIILLFGVVVAITSIAQTPVTYTDRLRFRPNALTLSINGELNYLLSTHKIQARINGVTESLATESFVTGAFWPLNGTASLGGNSSVTGATGTHDFSIGLTGNRLNKFSVYTDNEQWLEYDNGTRANRFYMLGTDMGWEYDQPGASIFNSLYLSSSGIQINADNGTNESSILLRPFDDDIRVNGGSTFKGFQYASSFAANNIGNDRWIPDMGAVNAAIAAGGGGGIPFADNVALVKNNTDNTKLAIFSAAGITTGTTRTYTLPNITGTLAALNLAQVFTTKQTFTGSSTFAGVNVGAVAGTPSTPSNGDIWYHSGNGVLNMYQSGAAYNIIGTTGTHAANRVALWNGSLAQGSSANLTFTSGVLNVIGSTVINNTFAASSGTTTYTNESISPTYNTTGTYSGTAYGIDYNPTLTSVTGLTNIAFRATSGQTLLGGTTVTSNTRLDVRGSGNTSSSTSGRFANSSDTQLLRIKDDGPIIIGSELNTTRSIFPSNDGSNLNLNGSSMVLSSGGVGVIGVGLRLPGNFGIPTNGGSASYRLLGTVPNTTFAWNAGFANLTAISLEHTLNTTGTFSGGIARGIYYNPTLTSTVGLTNIAFENTSGELRFGGVTQDDTKTRILAIDDTNGKVFYKASSSFTGAYIPLAGTATFTNNVTINGATNNLALGNGSSRLFNLTGEAQNLIQFQCSNGSVNFLATNGGMNFTGQTMNISATSGTGLTTISSINNIFKSSTGSTEVYTEDAALNTVKSSLSISRHVSAGGTPGAGVGVGVDFVTETRNGELTEIGGVIESVSTDVTNTSEDFDMVFRTMASGATADEKLRIKSTGNLVVPTTVTTAGTTGNQTINKISGTVNFAAAATSLTVTNSLVNANSIILILARTNDATCSVKNYVPAAGSFVINMTAGCTGETSVGFFVIN